MSWLELRIVARLFYQKVVCSFIGQLIGFILGLLIYVGGIYGFYTLAAIFPVVSAIGMGLWVMSPVILPLYLLSRY